MTKIEESQKISGVYIIESDIFEDLRGALWTSYLKKNFNEILDKEIEFNHDKFSISKKNVLRGIHFDNKTWKIISCIKGKIFQVIVDCRKNSSTFKSWQSFDLSEKKNIQILIPPRIGNAYLVKSTIAIYHYKFAYKGKYNDLEKQQTIKWNDNNLRIRWPIKNPILSKRDKIINEK